MWENNNPHGLCCCLVRSLSLMEKSSFMKLVNRSQVHLGSRGVIEADQKLVRRIPMIQEEISCRTSNLTPERLEMSFLMASSIGGSSNDGSIGIHDLGTSSPKPSSPKRSAPLLGP